LTWVGALTLLLLGWHVVESVSVRPHYLAYFNQLAGGPSQGYKHLADSSLDWGQDLPALKQWLDSNGLQPPSAGGVYLSYFGTGRPEYYRIQSVELPGFVDRRPPRLPQPLGGGVYCISATMLNVIAHSFWTPETEPAYQAAIRDIERYNAAPPNERAALVQQSGEAVWWQKFLQFDQRRMGRLAAYLRRREPDAQVGYSILIFRLSAAEVSEALYGPPPN
jgi:hypothetical protein